MTQVVQTLEKQLEDINEELLRAQHFIDVRKRDKKLLMESISLLKKKSFKPTFPMTPKDVSSFQPPLITPSLIDVSDQKESKQMPAQMTKQMTKQMPGQMPGQMPEQMSKKNNPSLLFPKKVVKKKEDKFGKLEKVEDYLTLFPNIFRHAYENAVKKLPKSLEKLYLEGKDPRWTYIKLNIYFNNSVPDLFQEIYPDSEVLMEDNIWSQIWSEVSVCLQKMLTSDQEFNIIRMYSRRNDQYPDITSLCLQMTVTLLESDRQKIEKKLSFLNNTQDQQDQQDQQNKDDQKPVVQDVRVKSPIVVDDKHSRKDSWADREEDEPLDFSDSDEWNLAKGKGQKKKNTKKSSSQKS